MRFKLTIVLLLANLAVFFVLWRLEQPAVVAPPPPGPIARDMLPDHLVITDNVNHQTREFKRDPNNNKWNIVQPINWPANDFAVGAIISGLQLLDVEISFSLTDIEHGGQSLKDFGLDKGQPILEVTLENSTRTQKLLVGSPTVYAGRLYVMNPEDRMVRVIAQGAISSLYAPIEELRDNRLFTTNSLFAKSLSVRTAPDKLVQFVKDNNTDLWQLEAPLLRPADNKQLNSVITDLGNLTVVNFLAAKDADPARQGLAPPRLTVEITGRSSQKLDLGDDVPNSSPAQLYAQIEDRPNIVFTVLKGPWFDSLLQAQDKLRDHQFLNFDPDKATAINFISPAGEIHLQRVGRLWQILDKDSTGAPRPIFDADPALVQLLLGSFHDLSARAFASDAPDALGPFGLDPASPTNPPLWKIVIQADKPVTLTLGRTGDKSAYRYFAKTTDTDSVYEINGDVLDVLDTNPVSYRDRTLEQLPDGAFITSFELTDLKAQRSVQKFELPDTKTTWAAFLKGHPALANDPGNVRYSNLLALVDCLGRFEVEFYRDSAFSPAGFNLIQGSPLAPWRFRLDVGIEIPAAGQTPAQKLSHQFYFSDRIPSVGQIGGTPGDSAMPAAVFKLTTKLFGVLNVLTDESMTPPEVLTTLKDLAQPINPNPPPAESPATPATPAPAPATSTTAAPATSAAPTP